MPPFLWQAADWLYNVNPTLCKDPPRATDGEYCYMGPRGGREGAVLCRDIQYSQATCVGSWMLPPEHHIAEGLAVTLVAFLVLRWTAGALNETMNVQKLTVKHPLGSRSLSLFCFGMMVNYKYFGYPNRLFYIVMPCNMQWALSFMQCFLIPQSWTLVQYTLLQMRVSYIMSVIIAIVTPETDDCVLPGEYAFYWLNHFILLILPAAYIANGSVSCFPQSTRHISTWTFNVLWWAYSCAAFALFYFIPVTFMAIYSGLNLNFMLHPPHDHFVLTGRWYRLKSILLLSLLFAVSRLLAYTVESAFRGGKAKAKTR